jgi:hypothetical protein
VGRFSTGQGGYVSLPSRQTKKKLNNHIHVQAFIIQRGGGDKVIERDRDKGGE